MGRFIFSFFLLTVQGKFFLKSGALRDSETVEYLSFSQNIYTVFTDKYASKMIRSWLISCSMPRLLA